MSHLYLVDGYGFVFRAYHSMPPLTRSDGTPVGAVYGFTNMLFKLKGRMAAKENAHVLVVLDAGSKTFRNDIYAEYKANRPPAPEDLIPQFPLVREAAEAMGFKVSAIKGFEADDIIATYAKHASREGMNVTVISSDKDLMQLVDDQVHMYDAMKDRRIEREQVHEKFGVTPDKVIDAQALIGDASDNVPGVPGIGPKIAAELINRFGSLDGVLANAEEVTQKKRRENLIEFADQARLSRELVTLCCDTPLDHPLEDLRLVADAPSSFEAFLRTQGFTGITCQVRKTRFGGCA